MLRRISDRLNESLRQVTTWRRFVTIYLATFFGGAAAVYLFILLVDPFGIVPFSLPIERKIVSNHQRHWYPQMVRSKRFDSLIVGTSTVRLIDPQLLDGPFKAKFANLAMDSMTAWEQQRMIAFFAHIAGPPKALIVGLDTVWCDPRADVNRLTSRGFPDWLYDDNPWNDYLYLLNGVTAEIAGRMVGAIWRGEPGRTRFDGFGIFTPSEDAYDLVRARRNIWGGEPRPLPEEKTTPALSEAESRQLSLPALQWLDRTLAGLPTPTVKVLAYMPVHVAAQPWPGTRTAAEELECKRRIADIARARGATVVDWRIASWITTGDENYWDGLHYRLPIARRIAHELASAALSGQPSGDGAYRLVVR